MELLIEKGRVERKNAESDGKSMKSNNCIWIYRWFNIVLKSNSSTAFWGQVHIMSDFMNEKSGNYFCAQQTMPNRLINRIVRQINRTTCILRVFFGKYFRFSFESLSFFMNVFIYVVNRKDIYLNKTIDKIRSKILSNLW